MKTIACFGYSKRNPLSERLAKCSVRASRRAMFPCVAHRVGSASKMLWESRHNRPLSLPHSHPWVLSKGSQLIFECRPRGRVSLGAIDERRSASVAVGQGASSVRSRARTYACTSRAVRQQAASATVRVYIDSSRAVAAHRHVMPGRARGFEAALESEMPCAACVTRISIGVLGQRAHATSAPDDDDVLSTMGQPLQI